MLSRLDTASFISSRTLANQLGVNPSQVRKDLALFGQFGVPGMGYEVRTLHRAIEEILGIDRPWRVIIVGCGNLGSALMKYRGFESHRFSIVAGFDSDPHKIGRRIGGTPVFPLRDLRRYVREHPVDIAAITVPGEVAQQTIAHVAACGIRGILNFTPTVASATGSTVLKIDLTVEFIRLACMLANSRSAP
jgi:redox-sensing transcriptional repressor